MRIYIKIAILVIAIALLAYAGYTAVNMVYKLLRGADVEFRYEDGDYESYDTEPEFITIPPELTEDSIYDNVQNAREY